MVFLSRHRQEPLWRPGDKQRLERAISGSASIAAAYGIPVNRIDDITLRRLFVMAHSPHAAVSATGCGGYRSAYSHLVDASAANVSDNIYPTRRFPTNN